MEGKIRCGSMVLVLAILASGGCNFGPRATESPGARKVEAQKVQAKTAQETNDSERPLSIQLNSEPVSLDPSMAEDGISLKIFANTMDGLFGYDSQGQLQKRLAESFEVSSDRKRYEFTLRKNAKWSDGRSVSVQDFVVGLQRALNPATGSKAIELISVLNAVREENGKLILELKKPAPYIIGALTFPAAFPLRSDVLQANSGHWPVNAPVTGAYRVASYVPEQKIVLEPNPHYYGGAPRISKLEFDIVRDESTALALFDLGKLDILTRVPSFDLDRLRAQGAVRVDPFVATYYIAFNLTKPPFNDLDWRRAIAGSIRRSEIVKVLGSGETPAWSFVPRGIEGFFEYRQGRSEKDPVAQFSSSVQKIRKLVEQGKLPPQITLEYDTLARNTLVAEKIQQDVLKALGLKISLSYRDWKSYVHAIHTDASQIYRYGWLAPFKDPISHLHAFVSGNPNDFSKWSNPRYDRLVQEIESMEPGKAREAKVIEAQKLLLEKDVVVVPIFHYVQVHAVSNRVKNFKVTPFGAVLVKDLELEKSGPGAR